VTRHDPDRHDRQSIRLRGWDYRQPGAYFVTIVTAGRDLLFAQMAGRVVALSPFGRMATAGWQRLAHHFSQVRLDEYVIMPNHVHGIIWITEDGQRRGEAFLPSDLQPEGLAQGEDLEQPARSLGMPHPHTERRLQSGSLGAVVGNFKSIVTRRVNRMRRTPGAPVWQSNFHERIIRNERELDAIRHYIRNNPANWDDDNENPDSVTR